MFLYLTSQLFQYNLSERCHKVKSDILIEESLCTSSHTQSAYHSFKYHTQWSGQFYVQLVITGTTLDSDRQFSHPIRNYNGHNHLHSRRIHVPFVSQLHGIEEFPPKVYVFSSDLMLSITKINALPGRLNLRIDKLMYVVGEK